MSSRELLLSAQFSIVRRYRYQRPVQQERNTPAIVILCSLFRSLSLSILLGPSGCILPGRLSCSTSLTILHSPFSVPSASLLSRRRLHFFPSSCLLSYIPVAILPEAAVSTPALPFPAQTPPPEIAHEPAPQSLPPIVLVSYMALASVDRVNLLLQQSAASVQHLYRWSFWLT